MTCDFADVESGEVGFFGAVAETHAVSPIALRLKVVEEGISEVENDRRASRRFGNQVFRTPCSRISRCSTIGFPADRRQKTRASHLNCGRLLRHATTQRWNLVYVFFQMIATGLKNGVQTTNNSTLAMTPTAALGCAETVQTRNVSLR